jgi:hypothetical protein
LINDENSGDDEERPRRHSTELSPRRKESPVSRSISSNFDETERINSADDPTSTRTITGKKKKVIGAGRHRLNGDGLPPLAPSSAASRRDDLTQNKGPPVGTPRPPPLVAQWAITSPALYSTAEKLTTISSDNERDDEEKYKSLKAAKRIVSPHPITTNRITNDKKSQLIPINNNDSDENVVNNGYKKSSRQKRHTHLNSDDDDDENTSRQPSSAQKSRSRLNNDSDEEDENRKKVNSREQNRNAKQYYDTNNDDDFNKDSNRRRPTSARKRTSSNSSHRSHSRTNENVDDDSR